MICDNCRVVAPGNGIASSELHGSRFIVRIQVFRQAHNPSKMSLCDQCFWSAVGTAVLPMMIALGAELVENELLKEKIGEFFDNGKRQSGLASYRP